MNISVTEIKNIIALEVFRYQFNKKYMNWYAENHKMLMKEIKEHLSKWRDIPYSWI